MTAKTLDAAIATHIATGSTTLAWFVEIIRPDTTAFRMCSGTRPVVLDGDTYEPGDGLTISSIAASAGLNVDNLKLTVGDTSEVLRQDIIDGVWDKSFYRIGQYNWASPSDGIILWASGWIANIEPKVGAYELECRDLRAALLQDTTRIHLYGCPYVLGDPTTCRKDLTLFTILAEPVTSVASRRQFTCSGFTEAAGWATKGHVTFTSGANANGISREIELHATGGVITLVREMPYSALPGDEVTIIAGCLHRPDEDCRDKFDNKVNNGGCDTKPSASELATGDLA